MQITPLKSIPAMILFLAAAACSGSDAVLVGNSVLAASAAVNPPVMRAIDGIPGWTRTGPPEHYNKEGLYGYIDGGAEIVLQYGFRELAVSTFKPAAAPAALKEIVLEIYRMASGEAAFGLYSTKLEGEEEGWPGIGPDNWISLGQASLVKGEFLISILAPECTDKEIGEFMAALEPKIPGRGTVRPKGMSWLPLEGMIPSSGRTIKGPIASRNESPFLEGDFWGFSGTTEATAYSAKYGTAPAVSKLIVVRLGTAAATITRGQRLCLFCRLSEGCPPGGRLDRRPERCRPLVPVQAGRFDRRAHPRRTGRGRRPRPPRRGPHDRRSSSLKS